MVREPRRLSKRFVVCQNSAEILCRLGQADPGWFACTLNGLKRAPSARERVSSKCSSLSQAVPRKLRLGGKVTHTHQSTPRIKGCPACACACGALPALCRIEEWIVVPEAAVVVVVSLLRVDARSTLEAGEQSA